MIYSDVYHLSSIDIASYTIQLTGIHDVYRGR